MSAAHAKPLKGQTGLYIHIPFCLSKCPYCAFVSSPCQDANAPLYYLDILKQQLAFFANHSWCRSRTFSSLFIGGGTPTIYSGAALADLVSQCLTSFSFSPSPEISVEANPNTVSEDKLTCLRMAGVNRLSLGMQSFSENILKSIGRRHTVEDGLSAFQLARSAGFENINLDFIYGLPEQTRSDLSETLGRAIKLRPEHIALYEMTIEPETPFALQEEQGTLELPSHDEVAEMEKDAQEQLQEAGYKRYEISNYAMDGWECRHNINYWQNGSYLGLGVSAVSSFDGLRVANLADYSKYIHCVQQGVLPFHKAEGLSIEAGFRESVITGLRMTGGVSLQKMHERYGLEPKKYYGEIIAKFEEEDMLVFDGDMMRLTEKSLPIANQVLAELV